MKPDTKMFLKFWGYTPADLNEIQCWKCGRNQRVQLMHIDQIGPGGRPSAHYIENIMPGCDICHRASEGNTQMKGFLWQIIAEKIQKEKPGHEWSAEFKRTWYYRSELKTKLKQQN